MARKTAELALLPQGLSDLLPPDAAHEASVVESLSQAFQAYGYERVKPPLIEFESSLLAGAGAAMADHTFRLMDPVSQRMMGLRADMTPQVARIAATRLKKAPRPLRLCYAGQVLRVRGSELKPERQIGQVGVELIGAAAPTADVEIVAMAAEVLMAMGLKALCVDLNIPTLVPALGVGLGYDAETVAALTAALDRKDAAAVRSLARAAHRALFTGLLAAAGPVGRSIDRLAALELPPAAASEAAKLADVAGRIAKAMPKLNLTIDPVEHRGFEYHNGVGFTLFAQHARNELGRGGRYISGEGEPSTGFSLYLDALLKALPAPARRRRILLPLGTARGVAQKLRAQGWVTVMALDAVADLAAEARRLDCGYVWRAGRAQRAP